MILSDRSLRRLKFVSPFDPALVNPASIDIRVGSEMIVEKATGKWETVSLEMNHPNERFPYKFLPGEFALVSTLERLTVPNGYAVDLRLKSSRAREGWDHSLAFWFDPGWDGIGTMEVRNATRFQTLPLYYGLRFAQIIVHRLDKPAQKPYAGRYQKASSVEQAKPERA